MIKLKLISRILCIAFSALTIVVYGKIEPLGVQGQGTASNTTGLFDIISGIFKNDYHESTMKMEESKTPKQRITGSISYILSDSGKCCGPSNPPTSSTPPKLPDHSNCYENEECESDRCEKTPTCNFIACCIPETGLNNGSRCNSKDQCMSDYCNESNVCSEKRPINSGCQADEDCVSGLICSQRLCKIGVGETCEDHNECETDRCSKENKCKLKEIVGGNCEQNVDCYIGICSDNICKLSVGEACENKNECESNICSDNKCKIGLSDSCQSNSECETNLCSESICNLYAEKKLAPIDGDGWVSHCDMSEGVAVVGSIFMKSIFLYEYGELQKEIKPTSIHARGLFGDDVVIDKYIVTLAYRCLEVFDRSGDHVRTIDDLCGGGNSGDVKTAGDLFAFVCEKYEGSKMYIYSIETGECLHTSSVAGKKVAMTEEYIVAETEYEKKLSVYSLKNDYELVGEIPGRFWSYDIFDQRVVASELSGKNGAAIYSTDGSLITSLQLKLDLLTNDIITDVSMNSRFVAIGFPYTNDKEGAIHIYDAQTGNFLQSMTSLTPEVDELYGFSLALSGVYTISCGRRKAAYFQSVLIDDDIYTDMTSSTEQIAIAEN